MTERIAEQRRGLPMLLPPGVVEQPLPACVGQKDFGLYVVDLNHVHEGSSGPFHVLVNYGQTLKPLQEPVTLAEVPASGVCLPDANGGYEMINGVPVAFMATDNLTRLVNRFLYNEWSNLDLGIIYAANFVLAARESLVKAREHVGSSGCDVIMYAPLRGGEILWIMAQALGYQFTIPDFRASRVLLKDRSYMVGFDLIKYQLNSGRYACCTKAIFADDCLAAGGSQLTILNHLWLAGLNQVGVKPEKAAIMAGIGVLRTANSLVNVVSNVNGRIFLGGVARSMNGSYYLTLSSEEVLNRFSELNPDQEHMQVGDMGTLMSLQDRGRRKALFPLIQQRTCSPKKNTVEVFRITEAVLREPDRLAEFAQEMLRLP